MNKTPRIVIVGSLNMDLVVSAPIFPQKGETIAGSAIHYIPGGKGANQAVACARLGAEVKMVGAVGDDQFGQSLLHVLEQEGIDVSAVAVMAEAATGVASIIHAEQDNSIIVVPGANGEVTPELIEQQRHYITAADVLLVQLEIPVAAVEMALRIAKEAGLITILNPAPARQLPTSLLSLVDYITPNETEFEVLHEAIGRQEHDKDREQGTGASSGYGGQSSQAVKEQAAGVQIAQDQVELQLMGKVRIEQTQTADTQIKREQIEQTQTADAQIKREQIKQTHTEREQMALERIEQMQTEREQIAQDQAEQTTYPANTSNQHEQLMLKLERELQRWSDAGLPSVVLTLGSKGALLYQDNKATVKQAPAVEVVDTTGAGDCLNGAFATCLAKGMSAHQALQLAVIAASQSVTVFGAQAGMPAWEQVTSV